MKKGKRQKGNVCIICSKELGEVTAARASHLRKHVRDGSLEERKSDKNKLEWFATGKEPQEVKKQKPIPFQPRHRRTHNFDPRIPVSAKSDRKGNISIKCRKCRKWINSMSDGSPLRFSDPRFIYISHCDTISLFPYRMLKRLTISPGREYIE